MGEYLWSPDGTRLGFVSTDRFHKKSTAKLADMTTGEVRTLFTETEKTHVQTRVQWQILWDTNEVLWYSQRDGTAQMYLYDLKTGQLKNKITSGVGPITGIARLDRADAHDVVQRRRQGEGTGSVLHAPLQGRPRRQELRLADARQRHAHDADLARRQVHRSTRSRSPTSRRRRRCATARPAR